MFLMSQDNTAHVLTASKTCLVNSPSYQARRLFPKTNSAPRTLGEKPFPKDCSTREIQAEGWPERASEFALRSKEHACAPRLVRRDSGRALRELLSIIPHGQWLKGLSALHTPPTHQLAQAKTDVYLQRAICCSRVMILCPWMRRSSSVGVANLPLLMLALDQTRPTKYSRNTLILMRAS